MKLWAISIVACCEFGAGRWGGGYLVICRNIISAGSDVCLITDWHGMGWLCVVAFLAASFDAIDTYDFLRAPNIMV